MILSSVNRDSDFPLTTAMAPIQVSSVCLRLSFQTMQVDLKMALCA